MKADTIPDYETSRYYLSLVCMYQSNLGMTYEDAKERARQEYLK